MALGGVAAALPDDVRREAADRVQQQTVTNALTAEWVAATLHNNQTAWQHFNTLLRNGGDVDGSGGGDAETADRWRRSFFQNCQGRGTQYTGERV
jgi:hypothetical protein